MYTVRVTFEVMVLVFIGVCYLKQSLNCNTFDSHSTNGWDANGVRIMFPRIKNVSVRINAVFAISFFSVGLFTPSFAATLIANGKAWDKESTWQDGEIPNAPGAVLNTGTDHYTISGMYTNYVIGTIETPSSTMPVPVKGKAFYIHANESGNSNLGETIAPTHSSYRWTVNTNSIVLDNGTSPAKFAIGHNDGNAEPFRYVIDVPVVLRSNLLIDHDYIDATPDNFFNLPNWGVAFARSISDDGLSKGITIDMAEENLGVAFFSDNTFSGDITVQKGVLRAKDPSPVQGELRTPFGKNNTIIATSTSSSVDLGGMAMGESQTLRLKGKTDTTYGTLFSTWQNASEYADWRGGVVLEGDIGIGGSFNEYPLNHPGNVKVSGNISESSASAVYILDGHTIFSGDNNFSGGIVLKKGKFTAKKQSSFGSGTFVFAGGTYKVSSSCDADPFLEDVRADSMVKIDVDEGVEFPISIGDTSVSEFEKKGMGALVFTNIASGIKNHFKTYMKEGDVIFDIRDSALSNKSFIPVCVCLNGNIRYIVRGNPDVPLNVHHYLQEIENGKSIVFRAEDSQTMFIEGIEGKSGNNVIFFEQVNGGKIHGWIGNTEMGYLDPSYIYGDSWASKGTDKVVAFNNFSSDWSGGVVDVTPALASQSVPNGTTVAALRFNTPVEGDELCLTLGGRLTLNDKGGTILVGSGMGSTTVRITGGELALASAGKHLRIINMNPLAPIEIDSDLIDNGNTSLHVSGVGCVKIRGTNKLAGKVYVSGKATLDIDTPSRLGIAQTANLYLNGGTLKTHGSFNLAEGHGNYFNFYVNAPGGAIDVSGENDVLEFANGANLNLANLQHSGGYFVKKGPGTWMPSHGKMDNLIVEEGTFSMPPAKSAYNNGLSENPGNITVKNGATLRGAFLASPTQAVRGGGEVSEAGGKKTLTAGSGDMKVDVWGQTLSLGSANYSWGHISRTTSFFRGTNTITIFSSEPGGFIETKKMYEMNFEGCFDIRIPTKSDNKDCILPKAEWSVAKNVTNIFYHVMAPTLNVHFGALTGEGCVIADSAQTYTPGYLFVGRDIEETKYFEGTLSVKNGAGSCGTMQLIKTGSNKWGLAGNANRFDGAIVVRNGALLVANDSPAESVNEGALGNTRVYIGDAETPQDGIPSLLADGSYEIGNEIRVHDSSPESVMPTVGGTAKANGARFTGDVVLYRSACFHAEKETSVTFSGGFTDNGYAISKTGEGTVALLSDVAVSSINGGTIETDGKVTFAEGAVIDVSDWSEAAFSDKEMRYILVEAQGGIEGFNRVTLEGVGANSTWRLVSSGTRVTLASYNGTTILIK